MGNFCIERAFLSISCCALTKLANLSQQRVLGHRTARWRDLHTRRDHALWQLIRRPAGFALRTATRPREESRDRSRVLLALLQQSAHSLPGTRLSRPHYATNLYRSFRSTGNGRLYRSAERSAAQLRDGRDLVPRRRVRFKRCLLQLLPTDKQPEHNSAIISCSPASRRFCA